MDQFHSTLCSLALPPPPLILLLILIQRSVHICLSHSCLFLYSCENICTAVHTGRFGWGNVWLGKNSVVFVRKSKGSHHAISTSFSFKYLFNIARAPKEYTGENLPECNFFSVYFILGDENNFLYNVPVATLFSTKCIEKKLYPGLFFSLTSVTCSFTQYLFLSSLFMLWSSETSCICALQLGSPCKHFHFSLPQMKFRQFYTSMVRS